MIVVDEGWPVVDPRQVHLAVGTGLNGHVKFPNYWHHMPQMCDIFILQKDRFVDAFSQLIEI